VSARPITSTRVVCIKKTVRAVASNVTPHYENLILWLTILIYETPWFLDPVAP